MNPKKSVRAMRGASWLVWGMFLVLLVVAGCGSNSSSASTSSSSSVDPFEVEVSVSQTTVLDGSVLLSPQVTFEVKNALGEVGFAVRSEPAVDWFVVENNALSFAGLLRADYDAAALASVEDGGDGKPIKLTIVATDAGRSGNNEATVDVTVLVALGEFSVVVSPSTVHVRDGDDVLAEYVLFAPSGARGAVSYEVVQTSPGVDWFDLNADGLLHFAEGQSANYDAEELKDVKDVGEGKPVVLTVRAIDAGDNPGDAGDDRRAMVELTVNVLPPPFELSASPSVVTIDSGSNRLNASNRIDITLVNTEYLLGDASYSVSTDLEGEWFAIRSSEDDARNGVLSLARVLEHGALSGLPTTDAGRLLRVRVRLEDRGRTMAASAEQLVDVVVTLREDVSPLWLDPSTLLSEVEQGSNVMTPEIRFTPNALGTMSYTVTAAPSAASGWFALQKEGENGVLKFADGQTAAYDVLTGLADAGVRSVTVTVTGTDAGRSDDLDTSEKENEASSSITLDVHQLALGLAITPAETVVFSGLTALEHVPSVDPINAIGRVRYALAEVRPAVDWFAIDAATGAISLVRPANYRESALEELSDSGSGRAVEVDIELTALDRTGAPSAVATLVVRVSPASTLRLFSDNDRTRVEHDSTALSAPIQFSTQSPTDGGAITYTSTTTPEVSWIAVGETDGVLSLSAAADYINLAGTSLNGVKEVVVTVTAADEAARMASASVIIEVARPAGAFHLLADPSAASVRHGDTALSPAITLSAEGAGTITVAQTSPAGALSWFAVGSDGVLGFAAGQMADYGTDSGDALEFVADSGQGKPVLVTLSATDTDSGAIAQTTVQVSVLPPLLTVSVSPLVASIGHGARAIDTALTVSVTQAVGVLSYEVIVTEKLVGGGEVDWFGVKPSSGTIYVRADRAVDWIALDAPEASDRSKGLSVRVRVTDSGRTGEDAAESSAVTLNVTPANFTIYASRGSAPVENGASDQSTTIRFYSEANIGAVTYSIAGTSPSVGWFSVVDDGSDGGDLHIAAGQTASYADAALADAVDSGQGKPIYVSVQGTEAGGDAVASVIIYVRPPAFDLQVSPIETELREQGTSLNPEVVFTPKGVVGSVSYQLAVSPAVDWFEVVNNKLELVYAADARSETIGTNTIQVYVTAKDNGRSSLDPNVLSTADVITVKLVPASGLRIELSATRSEFFEKGGQLDPPVRFEVKEASESVNYFQSMIEWNITLCSLRGCEIGFYLNQDDAFPEFAVKEEGTLFVRLEDANFWETKDYYDGRGDDKILPLYVRMILEDYDGENYQTKSRKELLLTMKNIPNDERITRFEGGELSMPEGDANELFFFPISRKLEVEATSSSTLRFDITDDRFVLRDVRFTYDGVARKIDAGAYGIHPEPYVTFLGWCAFKPRSSYWSGGFSDLYYPDWRLALQPGESLQYGEEPGTVTVTATIIDAAPGFETATAEFTVRVIERQDGTEASPFLVSDADELRSIATRFENDYTRANCDILPTCVDGLLAGFQTRVSHYRQTKDIDLESELEESIGNALNGEIVFHGNYNGGGYAIDGLPRSLFALIGATGVVEDVHLREVSIAGAAAEGAIIQEARRTFSEERESNYMSHRFSQLTLPYYDFYFANLWNRFDWRAATLARAEVISSGVSGSVSGTSSIGGLVGILSGGVVRESYSTASVSALDVAGGLVGRTEDGSTISSFASGGVLSSALFPNGSYAVGGLVGRTEDGSTISDSFASGGVLSSALFPNGSYAVGGLVGSHGSGRIAYSLATGVPSSSNEGVLLGALVGRVFPNAVLVDSYGLGLATLVGEDEGTSQRIYGTSDGIEAWTCSDAPLLWYSDTLDVSYETCADYTGDGGQAADYGWDFGASSEYPVPSYNVLTPAEIRALIPSP